MKRKGNMANASGYTLLEVLTGMVLLGCVVGMGSVLQTYNGGHRSQELLDAIWILEQEASQVQNGSVLPQHTKQVHGIVYEIKCESAGTTQGLYHLTAKRHDRICGELYVCSAGSSPK